MSHIAIDARIINTSTGRYVERLLTYLEKIDTPHKFSILVRAKDINYWKPTSSKFKIVVADYHQYSFSEQIGFYFFLKKLNPDLVHFCMPQQPLFYRGLAVTTVHDLTLIKVIKNQNKPIFVSKFRQIVFRHLLKSVLNRSSHIITGTQYVKNDVLKFQKISEKKISVTYEAADLVSKTEKPVEKYIGKKFIIVVGRSETYKNQRGAIEAHHKLLSKHPDLRLVIIGKIDKTSKKLQEEFQAKNYENIDFFGFASDAELAWFYSHCAAYVFPSFHEGFGLPGLEAMKHGAPVASSNATCLPEVYGDAALYFDPSSSDEMAAKISKILDDKKLRENLVKKGTVQAAKYSWQRMAEQTYEIYTQALDTRS